MGLRKPKQERLTEKLIEACDEGRLEEITRLLEAGADVNTVDDEGWQPLSSAVEAKNPSIDIIRFLISKGAAVDAPDVHGWTNLHRAIYDVEKEVAEFLIESGADINAATTKKRSKSYQSVAEGTTPLLMAVQKMPSLVLLLIERDADLTAINAFGCAAAHYAAAHGHYDILEKLIEKGASLSGKDNDGWTPLHHAAKAGHFNLVELLIEKGADITARDNKGRTAEVLARENQERSISGYLKGKAEPPKPKKAAKAELPMSDWTRTGEQEISRVSDKNSIGYKLTEIFNFESRVYLCLAKSLDTGVETQTLRFFDECTDKGMINTAREALEKLGVKVDEAVVAGNVIEKPKPLRAG